MCDDPDLFGYDLDVISCYQMMTTKTPAGKPGNGLTRPCGFRQVLTKKVLPPQGRQIWDQSGFLPSRKLFRELIWP